MMSMTISSSFNFSKLNCLRPTYESTALKLVERLLADHEAKLIMIGYVA